MSDFDELVDTEEMTGSERARLERVHRLLLQAGPPPELPASNNVRAFEPRRAGRILMSAVVAAAVVFGVGFAVGRSHTPSSSLHAVREIHMHGESGSAVVRVSNAQHGNWPLELDVDGLPVQRDEAAYYELWVTSDGGKSFEPCGTFRMDGGSTTVRFTVPYLDEAGDRWIVTAQRAGERTLGPVLLRT